MPDALPSRSIESAHRAIFAAVQSAPAGDISRTIEEAVRDLPSAPAAPAQDNVREASVATRTVPAWQREREELLRSLMELIRASVADGKNIDDAACLLSLTLLNKRYSDGRKIRLSQSTLARIYRAWLEAKKSDCVFGLNYRNPRKPALTEQARRIFEEASTSPGATSFATCYALVVDAWAKTSGTISFSLSMFVRGFSGERKARLLANFQAHRGK